MAWKIDLLGEEWREGDLPITKAIEIEDLLVDDEGRRGNWSTIHPVTSAKMAYVIVAVMYAHRHEVSLAEAYAKLETVTMSEVVAGIGTYSDLPTAYENGFPQSAAGDSTDT